MKILGPLPWPIDVAAYPAGGTLTDINLYSAPYTLLDEPNLLLNIGSKPQTANEPLDDRGYSPLLSVPVALNPFFRVRRFKMEFNLVFQSYAVVGTNAATHNVNGYIILSPIRGFSPEFGLPNTEEELALCHLMGTIGYSYTASSLYPLVEDDPPVARGPVTINGASEADLFAAYFQQYWMQIGDNSQCQIRPVFKIRCPTWAAPVDETEYLDSLLTSAVYEALIPGIDQEQVTCEVDMGDNFPDHVYTIGINHGGDIFSGMDGDDPIGDSLGYATGTITLGPDTVADSYWSWDGKYNTTTGELL